MNLHRRIMSVPLIKLRWTFAQKGPELPILVYGSAVIKMANNDGSQTALLQKRVFFVFESCLVFGLPHFPDLKLKI